eukprot:TRINITY_DN29032_c0_g1_i1.p1 TRINITY_DN29032_c0_g1~~TRINITY_DN29032_c0_g1_i1.p1  ORF type:complete len:146 (-),score=24.83 TRINITY_DN29032_c0_g1_i1:153-590(-)
MSFTQKAPIDLEIDNEKKWRAEWHYRDLFNKMQAEAGAMDDALSTVSGSEYSLRSGLSSSSSRRARGSSDTLCCQCKSKKGAEADARRQFLISQGIRLSASSPMSDAACASLKHFFKGVDVLPDGTHVPATQRMRKSMSSTGFSF